jgi:hypothetical protein
MRIVDRVAIVSRFRRTEGETAVGGAEQAMIMDVQSTSGHQVDLRQSSTGEVHA